MQKWCPRAPPAAPRETEKSYHEAGLATRGSVPTATKHGNALVVELLNGATHVEMKVTYSKTAKARTRKTGRIRRVLSIS